MTLKRSFFAFALQGSGQISKLKPVATIMSKQKSIDKQKNNVELSVKGRHDPCVVPRAVPIVECMAAIVLADHLLRNRTSKL